MNMPLPEDRPLEEGERDLVEKEGLCIGCHRLSGTPEWENIIQTYGRADTAEKHEKIMTEAVRRLMESSISR